jgi:hypothetical protein
MGLLAKPLSLLGLPVLVFFSVPLTICAVFTTTIALVLLAIRVSVVYVELGVALINASLVSEPEAELEPLKPASAPPLSPVSSPPRSRYRPSSSSSQDTAVPAARLHTKSGSADALHDLSHSTRDFEGVGGWRYYEDEEDEALWMGLHTRLDLPNTTPRRHQRRHTGDSRLSWSEETRRSPMRLSPIHCRTPTLAAAQAVGEEYFPGLRQLSTAFEPLNSALHSRRTSISINGGSPPSITASRRASIAISPCESW